MKRHLSRWLRIAGVTGAALALPATASAATQTVYAGAPPSTAKLVAKLGDKSLDQYNPDVNAFFNQHATVHVGDSVKFLIEGFHTVDFPARGGSDLPLIKTSGGLVSGVNDAAGNPFWFNGKVPNVGLNTALFKPIGAKVYTGASRIDTGLSLGSGAPKPFVIKFTKPGTYKYFCDVHPGMIGYVTVKPTTARIPSAKQIAATQLQALTADIKAAVKVARAKLPADTVDLGQSTPSGVELYSMFPASLTVAAGTVVTFQMSTHTEETHTATFGPVAELKALADAAPPALPAQEVFPSDPTEPIEQSATSHGDGFANTGVLDRDPSTQTIPASRTIQFNSPGTYHYVCLIHPFMQGTIIVK